MLRTKDAADLCGVHPQTLRSWEKEGKITAHRTIGNQRRFKLEELEQFIDKNKKLVKGCIQLKKERQVIYCRVSSHKQKEDLKRQISFMQTLFPKFSVISDVGSSLNNKRPGFQRILDGLYKKSIKTIAVSYKDRLSRTGFDLFEEFATRARCKILVVNNVETSPEQELVEDILSIITSFSGRIHGLRKYKKLESPKNWVETEEKTEEIMEKLDKIVE